MVSSQSSGTDESQRLAAEVRSGQLRALARQTPVNALVTMSVSLLTAVLLWPVAPHLGVVCWAVTHWILSAWVLLRYRRRPAHPRRRRSVKRALRRARLWALASGLVWGSSAAFLPVVPVTQKVVLILVVGGMAGGASTTLAAAPGAAALFIVSSVLPLAVYFFLQAELAYSALAMMGLVFTLAMIASTRRVYVSLVEQMRAEQRASDLVDRFEASRREWLEISETADAFALFDVEGRLLLWNDNYGEVLSLGDGSLYRGALHTDLLRSCSPAMEVHTGEENREDWIRRQLSLPEHAGEPVIQQLANGRWVRSTGRRTPDGHLVEIHTDITELRKTEDVLRQREAELHQAQRLETVGKLAGGIAHDFNNLLTIIGGYCDLLSEDLRGQASQHEKVTEIGRAAERAALLTQQLLAFSRKQVRQPRILDLNRVVRETETMLSRLIGEDITLSTRLDANPGVVRADQAQIEQIIMNLAVNAKEAMPDGGRLAIETNNADLGEEFAREHVDVTAGPYVLLAFRDTGVGMDEPTRQRVFEPFYTTKDRAKATGLGLSTVYGIVKQSGGHVEVESTPGAGASFRIYLPEERDDRKPADPASTPAPVVAGTETVLVAEDEESVRRFLCTTLRSHGYTVLDAPDGRRALEAARSHEGTIGLLVTDVVMPGMNGRVLFERIAASRPGIRVIFISGYPDDAVGSRGALVAGTEFLQKPFRKDVLLRKVREVLDHK